jgi:hypothetical protein
VFTKDGIRTLIDVVIADPTQADLLCRSYTIQKFVAFEVIQAKERNYCDQTSHWSIPPFNN